MIHRVKSTTLHRTAAHRKSLLRNLSDSIVMHEKIVTTLAKAKYVKPYIERLITHAKAGNTFNNIKYMKTKLLSDDAVRKILLELGPRFLERKGGYTRIIKLKNRVGDNSPSARIELCEKPKKVEKIAKKPEAKLKAKKGK